MLQLGIPLYGRDRGRHLGEREDGSRMEQVCMYINIEEIAICGARKKPGSNVE